jgi:hypothetical protein
LPARADAAGDHIPKLLPAAATFLELLFLTPTTTTSRFYLPNLLLPVSSLHPPHFLIPSNFIMLDVLAVQIMHKSLVPSSRVILGLGFDPDSHLDY